MINREESSTLWETLKAENIVGEEMPVDDNIVPWFIRILLGVAGWIGAGFILLFIALSMNFLIDSIITAIISGLVLCGTSYFAFRKKIKNDFLVQFMFAICLAGQGLIYFGIFELLNEVETIMVLSIFAIHILFFILFNNFILKLISVISGVSAFLFFICSFGFLPYASIVLFASLAILWLYEYKLPLKPIMTQSLGYGITLLMIVFVLVDISEWNKVVSSFYDHSIPQLAGVGTPVINSILITGVLVWIGLTIKKEKTVLIIIFAVLLGATEIIAPGLAIMIALVILGFAHGNLILFFSGIVSTLGYMSYYYYKMDLSLLYKSIFLICFGIILLIIRFVLKKKGVFND